MAEIWSYHPQSYTNLNSAYRQIAKDDDSELISTLEKQNKSINEWEFCCGSENQHQSIWKSSNSKYYNSPEIDNEKYNSYSVWEYY